MQEPIPPTPAATAPTVSDQLRVGILLLSSAGIPSARLDVEVLLAAALCVDRTTVYARPDASVPAAAAQVYATLLNRRAAREPLAYIVGYKEFWSLEIDVTPAVLIPRPETELLVEIVLGILRDGRTPDPSLCDMGTGSGCIAVALAREAPRASIVGVDISSAALEVVQRNAAKHGVTERIELIASDLFATLQDRRFNIVVTNPPYVAAEDLGGLEPELRWEPQGALNGGNGGLDVIERLLSEAVGVMASQAWLVMEIGAHQGPAVEELATQNGFINLRIQSDYAAMPRVLVAQVG